MTLCLAKVKTSKCKLSHPETEDRYCPLVLGCGQDSWSCRFSEVFIDLLSSCRNNCDSAPASPWSVTSPIVLSLNTRTNFGAFHQKLWLHVETIRLKHSFCTTTGATSSNISCFHPAPLTLLTARIHVRSRSFSKRTFMMILVKQHQTRLKLRRGASIC